MSRRRKKRGLLRKLKWAFGALFTLTVAVIVAVIATLSSYDFEELRDLVQAEAKAATGRDLIIAGPVDLKLSLSPSIKLEDVTFANADWGSPEPMAKVSRFELEVPLLPLLSGDLQIKRFVIVEPEILLETDGEGRGNWVFETGAGDGGASADLDEALLPSFDKLAMVGGSVTYRAGGSGKEWKVDLDQVTAKAASLLSETAIAAKGSYRGVPFDLDLGLGSLKGFISGPSVPMNLKLKTTVAELTANGALTDLPERLEPDLAVSLSGNSLADLSPMVGAQMPALGPYSLAGQVRGEGDTYNVADLALKLGGSDLAGNGSITLAETRPLIAGNFTSTLIDLADLGAGGAASGGSSPFVFTEDPLPLDDLDAVDANLTAAIATFKASPTLVMEDVTLALVLQDGQMKLAPLSSGFAGGRIEGSAAVTGAAEARQLSLQMKGNNLDYGRLLRDFGVDNSVNGVMNLDLDLAGPGASLRAFASGLNGRSDLVSNKGTINNRLLKVFAVGLGDILGPLLGGEQNANINCLVSRFSVKNGQAHSRALVLDTHSLTLVGQGGIDLRSEGLDLNFDTETSQPSLASLSVPFNVRGTLKNPEVTPDPLGAAANVVGTVGTVAETLGDLAGSLGDMIGIDTGTSSGGEVNPCVAALSGRAPASSSSGGSTTQTTTSQPKQKSTGTNRNSQDKSFGEAVDDLTRDLKSLFD